MQIGPYTVSFLLDGMFKLDGGAMFGIVPKPLWEKAIPPDARNRIPLALRVVLLEGNGRRILLDDGIGDKWTEKQRDIYGLERTRGGLLDVLAARGLKPDDITDVVITHLHFDHAGGSTLQGPDGKLAPTFPKAAYHVQRRNFDHALHPNERDAGSYLEQDFKTLADRGQFRFVKGEDEILPHVFAGPTDGHTLGMQTVHVRDGNTTMVYCGDLIPTAAHVRMPWIMGYDLQPLVILDEKRKLLSEAAEKGWILVFEHDPFHAGAKVKVAGKDFAVAETVD